MRDLHLPKNKKVVYFKEGHIAYVVLNRPEKVNAIDIDMAKILAKTWDDIRDDENVWAVILTGAGNNFSSGFDISVIHNALPLIRSKGFKLLKQSNIFGEGFRLTPSMHNLWKPIVVALDGHVNGAGLWLALEGDIRIATPEVRIGLFEGRIGYPVEFAAFLTRYMPPNIALELMLTSELMDAERAYQLGIFNKIVPRERLLEEAERVARNIVNNIGPLAMRAMKRLVRTSWDLQNTQSLLQLSDVIINEALMSKDLEEGLKAFIEKRPPRWEAK